jgi:hypothetical protein
MLAALVGAAYLAIVWVPIYVDHQDVERIVRETGNAAVKSADDRGLVGGMLAQIGRVASREVEQDGRVVRKPAIEVLPEDVVWERDGQRLRIAFSYTRELVYPWIGRRQERVMAIDLTLDVTRPDWNESITSKLMKWGSR